MPWPDPADAPRLVLYFEPGDGGEAVPFATWQLPSDDAIKGGPGGELSIDKALEVMIDYAPGGPPAEIPD